MDRNNNIESLFELAKSEPTGLSFDAAKLNFKEAVGSTSYTSTAKIAAKNFKLLKIIIMSISIISIAVVSIYLFTGGKESKSNPEIKENFINITDTIENQREEAFIRPENMQAEENLVSNSKVSSLPIREISTQQNILELKNRLKPNSYPKLDSPKEIRDYFPKLTKEEIEDNNKRIKRMRKDFLKKKKDWSYYPSGSFQVQNKTRSVQAFYVKSTEVTNLEYKTFLFDLLRKGEKEAFNKAKPNQKQWTETFGENAKPMEDLYFSHPAYYDYPVSNVSAEGAKMYCDWFTSIIQDEAGKSIMKFRLPFEIEWKYIASESGELAHYPWGKEIRNEKGCYYANFHAGTESDTTINTYKADGGFFTVKSESYFPNQYGVYNISGNVSELVLVKDDNSISVKQIGGSFISDYSELKVTTEAKPILFPAGSPDVGFRPVITHLGLKAREFVDQK